MRLMAARTRWGSLLRQTPYSWIKEGKRREGKGEEGGEEGKGRSPMSGVR